MKKTVLQIVAVVLLTLIAGTAYNMVTEKLEFFVSSNRYPNAKVCKMVQPESVEVATDVEKPARDPNDVPDVPNSTPDTTPPAAEEASGETDDDKIPHVKFAETKELWQDGLLFIDARKAERYVEGHIPGALSIPAFAPGIEEKVGRLAEDENRSVAEPVIVYCNRSEDCEASHIVGGHLENAGFLEINIFEGGFPEWSEQKMPVHEGDDPGAVPGEERAEP